MCTCTHCSSSSTATNNCTYASEVLGNGTTKLPLCFCHSFPLLFLVFLVIVCFLVFIVLLVVDIKSTSCQVTPLVLSLHMNPLAYPRLIYSHDLTIFHICSHEMMIVEEQDNHVAQDASRDHLDLWDNEELLTCLEQATFGEADSASPATVICPPPFYPPHVITQPDSSPSTTSMMSLRVNRVWRVLIDALSGLHDCRRLDQFHASSVHRISTILLYLSRCIHHPSYRGCYPTHTLVS